MRRLRTAGRPSVLSRKRLHHLDQQFNPIARGASGPPANRDFEGIAQAIRFRVRREDPKIRSTKSTSHRRFRSSRPTSSPVPTSAPPTLLIFGLPLYEYCTNEAIFARFRRCRRF